MNPIQQNQLPDVTQAVEIYQEVYSGTLTIDSEFGWDPLSYSADLKELRKVEFERHFSVKEVFEGCVDNTPRLLQEAVIWFYEKTLELMTT